MKTIHINRHAKSSWKSNANSDHDRPLNKRGKINAKFMSKLFASDNSVDLIISSTATRAKKTAIEFAKALGKSTSEIQLTEKIYAADTSRIMDVINVVDDKHDSIMLFGHNPGFSDLAAYLDGNFGGDLVTCARVKIVFEVDTWAAIGMDSGQVVEHDYPRKYPEMANL